MKTLRYLVATAVLLGSLSTASLAGDMQGPVPPPPGNAIYSTGSDTDNPATPVSEDPTLEPVIEVASLVTWFMISIF